MKIVVAPDAYKGTLTQVDAANIIKNAIMEVDATHNVVIKPMADGGEGMLDALLRAIPDSKRLPVKVTGPLGRKIETCIGVVYEDTAVIEIASMAGLPFVPKDSRDPYKTTTYGIGEAIRIALDKQFRKFIIGLGGSATNDGGFGMLMSLGATFKNSRGEHVGIFGEHLLEIETIHLETLDPRLASCTIRVATDVENPLCGQNGATFVFGPQKGANRQQIEYLDQAMGNYSKRMQKTNSLSLSLDKEPGAGAAGGLGFAFMAMGGKLLSGAKLISEVIELEDEIKHADLVISGEGESDTQTLDGKAPGYVAALARKYHVPSMLISGNVTVEDRSALLDQFTEIHTLINGTFSKKQAMNKPKMVLFNRTKEIFKYIQNQGGITMVKAIHTEDAPAAIGPYSQAIEAGNFVYVSGQIGIDPQTKEVEGGIEKQTKQVLENLKAILTEAGTDFSEVVKFTIYLDSMDDFATVNDIYGGYLQEPYPSRATVEVGGLPKGALVEMDVVVYKK
ncbi:MAG TPA: glycerate kinase [Virgibacillus sp.]|nr:glycerate kinase [Virgibacillus sp.]HLR66537.1 glycerate kinase [Virgibacillus sp.]